MEIPGVSCFKPMGALYMFPRLDPKKFKIKNDEKFVLDLLLQKKILVVQGSAFNITNKDHFRLVFLPHDHKLESGISSLKQFLSTYQQ